MSSTPSEIVTNIHGCRRHDIQETCGLAWCRTPEIPWVAGGQTIENYELGISSLARAGHYTLFPYVHIDYVAEQYISHSPARGAFITIAIAKVRYDDNATNAKTKEKKAQSLRPKDGENKVGTDSHKTHFQIDQKDHFAFIQEKQ